MEQLCDETSYEEKIFWLCVLWSFFTNSRIYILFWKKLIVIWPQIDCLVVIWYILG